MQKVVEASDLALNLERASISSVDLYSVWIHRLKKTAVLSTLELRDVRNFCYETTLLEEILNSLESKGPWVEELFLLLPSLERPLSAIDTLITPSGEIRSDASPLLDSLYREREKLAKEIQLSLEKLVNAHDLQEFLQDRFVTTREGRWVLPIRSGSQHFVDGIIQSRSMSRQTVFIEPAVVVPLNNRLRQVEIEIEEEIERLLTETSRFLQTQIKEFETCFEGLQCYDVIMSFGQLSLILEAQSFEFSEGEIQLRNAFNPVMLLSLAPTLKELPQLRSQIKLVKNDLNLSASDSRILLLSGPNAGGKTVLLKTIGLAAQMARCGLPICVGSGSRIGFFKEIHVVMGDAQSVGTQLSTFAGHLKKLQEATYLTGSESLVLVDEICGATDPEEGSALARAFIEEFLDHKILGIVTSHLGPLKTGWTHQKALLPGSMEFDLSSSRPTFRFMPGLAGESLALQMAKRVGVNESILSRAEKHLAPETRARLNRLEELEDIRKILEKTRTDLQSEIQKSQREKQHFEKLIADFKRERDQELQKQLLASQKKIDEAIQSAQAAHVFKKHESLREIQKSLPQIVKVGTKSVSESVNSNGAEVSDDWKSSLEKWKPGTARTDAKSRVDFQTPQVVKAGASVVDTESETVQSADEFLRKFPPGSKVYVHSLQQNAVVQSEPSSKGEVAVLAGSLRLSVPWQDLSSSQGSGGASSKRSMELGRRWMPSVPLPQEDRELDIRGKTAEEALKLMESALDRAMAASEDRIRIVHGNGTAALKKAVRTYLSRSAYVKSWSAEGPNDGATLVLLGP